MRSPGREGRARLGERPTRRSPRSCRASGRWRGGGHVDAVDDAAVDRDPQAAHPPVALGQAAVPAQRGRDAQIVRSVAVSQVRPRPCLAISPQPAGQVAGTRLRRRPVLVARLGQPVVRRCAGGDARAPSCSSSRAPTGRPPPRSRRARARRRETTRQAREHPGPPARHGRDQAAPAQLLSPLAHRGEPNPGALLRREPAAVVDDLEHSSRRASVQPQAQRAARAPAWRTTFASASIAMRTAATSTAAGSGGRSVGHVDLDPRPAPVGGVLGGALPQRLGQPKLVQRRRPQAVDQPPHVRDRRPHPRGQLVQQCGHRGVASRADCGPPPA